jgi:hypothetical protein
MGDRPRFWAERGTSFRLPNSDFAIGYATALHDWSKGCDGEQWCFTDHAGHGVAAGALSPDLIIRQSYTEYEKGMDPVVETILKLERSDRVSDDA